MQLYFEPLSFALNCNNALENIPKRSKVSEKKWFNSMQQIQQFTCIVPYNISVAGFSRTHSCLSWWFRQKHLHRVLRWSWKEQPRGLFRSLWVYFTAKWALLHIKCAQGRRFDIGLGCIFVDRRQQTCNNEAVYWKVTGGRKRSAAEGFDFSIRWD